VSYQEENDVTDSHRRGTFSLFLIGITMKEEQPGKASEADINPEP